MSTIRTRIKTIITNLIFIICVSYILIKCLEENTNQESTYSELKVNFILSAMKSNVKKSDFQYDGLSPQESFFVNCKLKFMILKSSGELTDIERLIEFDNDSISKITTRKTIYRGKANGDEAGRDWYKIKNDSVFILDFKNSKKQIYKKSKLVKTLKLNNEDENNKYIYKVKSETEKNYNCR